MSTRSPVNGTPSPSRSLRWREPLASDPSARTIRCQGTVGSSHSDSTAPAKRGAPGDTSPYARTKPGGVARMRASTRSARDTGGSVIAASMLADPMTYSIVARDPATGELGAAVQSHWFSVGSLCPWARPGVGAVATQSIVEPAHGPNGLDRLAAGEAAPAALAALLATDPLAGAPRPRRPRPRRPPPRWGKCARSASSTAAGEPPFTPAPAAWRTPATSSA